MNTYKITFLRHLTVLAPLLITITGYTAYCYFTPSWSSFAALTGWIILAIIAVVPTLAAHVQYFIKNGDLKLTVNADSLVFQTKEKTATYSFSSIIELFRTSSYGKGSWYLFGNYRHYKIIFNDGTEYIITSLLVPNIEQNLISRLNKQEEKRLKVIAFV